MIDFELMDHQKDVVYKSQFINDMFLSWEMGTGKTCTTIQLIRHRSGEEGRLLKTLILCPSVVVKNWKKEIEMFSKINPKAVCCLTGPVKKRAQIVTKNEKTNCVFITNYEAMQNADFLKALDAWGPEILVCDESHNLKNYKSKRAKAVAKVADKCKHRYLLTGTPILNSPMDLFMQFRVLDGHLGKKSTFGANFFWFRNTYFQDMNAAWSGREKYFPDWQPRPSMFKQMHELLAKKTSIVKKSDVLKNLPDLIKLERFVELSPEQKKMYKELKRDFVTFLDEKKDSGEPKAVVARLAITKALRLQQVVAGFLKTDEGEIIRIEKNPRREELKNILEEICTHSKVIVWTIFKESYAIVREVCEELELGYRELHGAINTNDKYKNAEEFNTDPEVKVMIGNPAAGGVGINLVAASYMVYYTRGFKLGDDLQSEARNYRRGSEIHDKITRINLVSEGTMDERINEALNNKQDISKKILEWRDV